MARKRRYQDGDVQDAIEALAIERPEWSPAQIRNELDQGELKGRLPSARTVQEIVKRARPADPSAPWSLADAEPSTVPLVLPVLAAVVARTQGQRNYVTRGEAEWLAKLRGAYPDLDPWQAYRLARLYMARVERRDATLDLDLYLALAPWRRGETEAQYRRLLADGVIPAPPASVIASEVVTVGVPPQEMAEHQLFTDRLYDKPEVREALEKQRRELRRLKERES